MKRILLFIFIALVFTATITDNVLNQLSLEDGKADILIMMKDTGSLDTLKFKGKPIEEADHITRGRVVVSRKVEVAERTQREIIQILKREKLNYQSFWVSNCIAVKQVPEKIIYRLAKRSEVRLISSNKEFNTPLIPEEQPISISDKKPEAVEWNVKWVKADKVWEKGFTGQGMVVGVADTGIEYDHPALVKNYRGNNNGSFEHNYNWFDGLRDFPNCGRCPCKGEKPCDDQGHGTHCVGTAAGGVDRKIGVAPGAKWIGCRAFSDMARRASPQTFLNCLQFFAAPTDLQGNNRNPDLRPHSTSHSYGCPTFYCPNSEFLKEAAETLKKEGVMMAVSAGNSGPSCSSVNRPPGHMGNVFSVGASNTNSNTLARFSSRGPITLDRSGRRKPDITAPGVAVWSSILNKRYASYSGTSMASPNVNGCVALLWSAVPSLTRKIDETMQILEKSAVKMDSNECQSSGSPNNLYGHGIINIEAAVEMAQKLYDNKN